LLAKLKSRKLWIAVGGVITVIISIATKSEAAVTGIWQIVGIVVSYIGVQGVVDTATVMKGN
jgi:hypothetical protein